MSNTHNINYLNDLIPCEICNNVISFNDYITHLDNCVLNSRVTNFNYTINNTENFINRPLNQTNNSIHQTGFINSRPNSRVLFNIRPISTTRASSNINQLTSNLLLPMFLNTNTNNNINRIQPISRPIPINLNNSILQLLRDELDNNNYTNEYSSSNLLNYSFNNTSFDNIITNLINLPNFHLGSYNDFNDDFNEFSNLEDVSVSIGDINKVTKIIEYNDIENKEDECIICTDTYSSSLQTASSNNSNKIFRVTLCNHIFCDECISRWLSISKKCALCNVNLEDLYNNKNANVADDSDDENIIIDDDDASDLNVENESTCETLSENNSDNESNDEQDTLEEETFLEGDSEAYEIDQIE